MILQFKLAFRAENDDARVDRLLAMSLKNKMVTSVVVVVSIVSIVSSQWEPHNDTLQLEVALHRQYN